MKDFGENLKNIYPELQQTARKWSNYHPADADDLIQKTLLKALEKQHLYKEEGTLIGWVVTIMKNIHFDSSRKMKGKTHVEFEDEQHSAIPNDKQIEVDNTLSAIQKLGEKCQAILNLIAEEYKYAEISKKLSLPMGTVMSQLARCRTKLFEALNQ